MNWLPGAKGLRRNKGSLERAKGFEPSTPTLARLRFSSDDVPHYGGKHNAWEDPRRDGEQISAVFGP
jgi:hypothetical protein